MDALRDKKPLLITLAAFAVILILAAAAALLLRGFGGESYAGADAAPYPYAWVEQKNGTITLTMETGKAPDAGWTLGSVNSAVLNVSVGDTRGKKTKATLTPESAGHAPVTFLLQSGEDTLAELRLDVSVEGERPSLSATVTSHSERARQGTVRGGEETGHPYTVRADGDGLTIFVEEQRSVSDSAALWQSESSDSLVAHVTDVSPGDGGVTVRLETRANGSAEVRVSNESDGIAFVFDVEVTGGSALLTGWRTETSVAAGETQEQ